MTSRVIPLRSADVIDRRDPGFWRRDTLQYWIDRHDREIEAADAKLRIYERICGGDDDGGKAA